MLFSFLSSGRDRKKVAAVAILFLVIGAACLTVGALGVPGKPFFQGGFALCVMVSIFFFVRYNLTEYRYEVREHRGVHYLYIVQINGKRESTQLYISIADIREFRPYPPRKRPKRREYLRSYTYNTAIFSPTEALFVESEDGIACVRLEGNEAFLSELRALWRTLRFGKTYDPAHPEDTNL